MKDKIKLFKAIAEFQQEAPVLLKATDGYGYKYVTFDHIVAQIKPLLKKFNLGFTQLIEGRGLTTIIFHTETGESIQGYAEIPDIDMKGMNKYQSFGAGITYYRRYALTSSLGLLADKDIDANIYKNDDVKSESKINKKDKDVSKDIETHIDLDIGDANWDKVLNFIARNKNKGLENIVKTLTTKYKMTATVKKVIAKEVSNAK